MAGKRDAIFRRSSRACQVAGEQQEKAPVGASFAPDPAQRPSAAVADPLPWPHSRCRDRRRPPGADQLRQEGERGAAEWEGSGVAGGVREVTAVCQAFRLLLISARLGAEGLHTLNRRIDLLATLLGAKKRVLRTTLDNWQVLRRIR